MSQVSKPRQRPASGPDSPKSAGDHDGPDTKHFCRFFILRLLHLHLTCMWGIVLVHVSRDICKLTSCAVLQAFWELGACVCGKSSVGTSAHLVLLARPGAALGALLGLSLRAAPGALLGLGLGAGALLGLGLGAALGALGPLRGLGAALGAGP